MRLEFFIFSGFPQMLNLLLFCSALKYFISLTKCSFWPMSKKKKDFSKTVNRCKNPGFKFSARCKFDSCVLEDFYRSVLLFFFFISPCGKFVPSYQKRKIGQVKSHRYYAVGIALASPSAERKFQNERLIVCTVSID